MSTNTLSIIVSKKDLEMVVGRAGLAAMTEEGQNEILRASNETKGCIRIVAADGKIVFESSVSRFSSKYVVTHGEGNAEIVSEGETCVPAKELKKVSGKIKDGRKVSLSFIATPPDPTLNASPSSRAVASDGVLEVGTISGSKVVSRTKIEAYSAAHFSAPQYPETSSLNVVISGKASCLKGPCGIVGFAVNPDDLKEIYNKFAIFTSSEGIYFLGSDGRRAAVVTAKGDSFENFLKAETEAPILIDAEYLAPVLSSLSDDDPLILGMDADQERVYVCSGNTTYCVNMIEKSKRVKYPNYKRIMSMKTKVVILLNRDELSESLAMLEIVNDFRGGYAFKDDSQVIELFCRGIGAVKESSGNVEYTLLSPEGMKDKSFSLHTKGLNEGLKKMSCDHVKMTFTEDELRVRIEDEKDPSFLYFVQVMNPNEV